MLNIKNSSFFASSRSQHKRCLWPYCWQCTATFLKIKEFVFQNADDTGRTACSLVNSKNLKCHAEVIA